MASRGDQIAERIRNHLRRFENDKEINKPLRRARPYYWAGAGRTGRSIYIVYISYQPRDNLTFDQAEAYADWLDAGNVGKHWDMEEAP